MEWDSTLLMFFLHALFMLLYFLKHHYAFKKSKIQILYLAYFTMNVIIFVGMINLHNLFQLTPKHALK